MNNKDTVEAPERIWLTPQFADAAAVIGGGIYHVNLSEEDRKGCVEYARVDPPAAPKCSLCEHESLFSDGGTIRCKKPVRTETARDKSTAETHAEDFTACGCKCVFAPPAPDEADKALAQQIEDFLLMPHGVELKALLPRLQTRILAALAQARKEGAEAQRESDAQVADTIQRNSRTH